MSTSSPSTSRSPPPPPPPPPNGPRPSTFSPQSPPHPPSTPRTSPPQPPSTPRTSIITVSSSPAPQPLNTPNLVTTQPLTGTPPPPLPTQTLANNTSPAYTPSPKHTLTPTNTSPNSSNDGTTISTTNNQSQTTLVGYKPVASDFTLFHVVGQGAYAKVYFSQNDKLGSFYAMKLVDKNHVARVNKIESVTIERNVLSTLKGHPGVVHLTYTLQDSYSLYFALEFCLGGELLDQIRHFKSLPLETVRFYAAELAETLHFMHLKGIVHRDIKPSNILLTEAGHIKVCDFGTAKILTGQEAPIPQKLLDELAKKDNGEGNTNDGINIADVDDDFDFDAALQSRNDTTTRKESFVGTALYCYPEMLSSHYLTFGADWWSFGIILYEMLTGSTPFHADSEYLIFQKIQSGTPIEFPPDFDPLAQDLITKLIHPDPRQRLGVKYEQEREIFQHAFFKPVWNQCRTAAIKKLQDRQRAQQNGTINSDNDINTSSQQQQQQQQPGANSLSNEDSKYPNAIGLEPGSEEYKQLFKIIKPVSIFALQPPTYWVDEERVSANKKIITAYREKQRAERKAANNGTVSGVLRPSTTQQQQQQQQQRASLPGGSPLSPISLAPQLSNTSNNQLTHLQLNSDQSNTNNNLSNYSANLSTPSNNSTLSPIALPRLSLPSTQQSSNEAGSLPTTTPKVGPTPVRVQYGGYNGDSSDDDGNDGVYDDEDENEDEIADFGTLASSGRSASNLQGLRSPDGNRLATGPASGLNGTSSILSAVVGGPEYKQHFTSMTIDPQFQQERWDNHLRPGEHVLAIGLIVKNSRWSSTFFVKKRQLILTSSCRLIYIDPDKNTLKGEILIVGEGFSIKVIDAKHFELTSCCEGNRTFKIFCEQRPSIVSWFARPNRDAAPKILPPGEAPDKSEKYHYLYPNDNKPADHWRWLIETGLQFTKQGGVLKRCGEIYQRQQHLDEHLGATTMSQSSANLGVMGSFRSTADARGSGKLDGNSTNTGSVSRDNDRHYDRSSNRHSGRVADPSSGRHSARPDGPSSRPKPNQSRPQVQRGSLRQQMDAQKAQGLNLGPKK